MKAVVFLGPTLPIAEARARLDAEYRPPVAMGDVYRAVERDAPEVIAIIDGYFDSVPSVWHKEILFALSKGVRVLGASSMGALRAAELVSFGMEGVGSVFGAYRSGELEDDDEVAVAHGDAETGFRSLSVAMVNVRAGIRRAVERRVIGEATGDAIITLVKSRHYPERSWELAIRDAEARGLALEELRALRSFVEAERPDVKREDAIALLEVLAANPVPDPAAVERARRASELVPTVFWDKLKRNERSTGAVRDEGLRRFVKATEPALFDLQKDSLLAHLAKRECDALGVELTQEVFDHALRSFRLRRGLTSADSIREWLDKAGVSADQFRTLMEIEARIGLLVSAHAGEIDEHLIDALALSGRLGEARARSVRTPAGGTAATAEELEAFYRRDVRPFIGSLAGHARELGFASGEEILDEVRKIFEPAED